MRHKEKKEYSPRKADISSLGSAITEWLSANRMNQKYSETRLIASWEKMMGKTIASRTSKVFIKEQKMYVKLTSAPLKNELTLSKYKILDIFDKEVGKGIVHDVIFL